MNKNKKLGPISQSKFVLIRIIMFILVYVYIYVYIITGYTKPEVQKCVSCSREFLAPVEDSMCVLPCGSIVSYPDPVLECPLCDESGFGEYMNKDFMPELVNKHSN